MTDKVGVTWGQIAATLALVGVLIAGVPVFLSSSIVAAVAFQASVFAVGTALRYMWDPKTVDAFFGAIEHYVTALYTKLMSIKETLLAVFTPDTYAQ